MAISYSQLAQARENSTNAVSVYSPGAGETVQITKIVVTNTSAAAVKVRIFHDDDGTTYDESTALVWDLEIDIETIFEMKGLFMNDATGNLAYRSAAANDLTITVYGIVKS